MRDSLGNCRLCYPRIAAYLADYPEQILINIAAGYNSPVTTAKYITLGDPTPHPRRTREWILSHIAEARKKADPNDVKAYTVAARELGLNAVDRPFWEDLPGYEPDLVICPDILHGVFRFWRDHILNWVQYLVGDQELDRRLAALQPLIGIRHFAHGISHLSQWTGREDRELQRVLLVVIAGASGLNENSIRCLRAFHDFLYLVQYRSHSTSTLEYLETALKNFHSLKAVFIRNKAHRGKNGVLRHFCIPKLAAFHEYGRHIRLMGSSVQFSTEVTETCHQEMAKTAYRATNRKDFFMQMCGYLNRLATFSLLEELSTWHYERLAKKSTTRQIQPPPTPDYITFIERMTEAAQKHQSLEIRRESRARGGYVWLTIKPDRQGMLVNTISQFYGLPNFRMVLVKFLDDRNVGGIAVNLATLRCDTWYRFRTQRPTVQDDDELADTRTILAVPPSVQETRYGLCNCVLIKEDRDAEPTGIEGKIQFSYLSWTDGYFSGYRVGQVRLVFQPNLPILHPWHGTPLACVYWFSKVPVSPERNINMYKVRYLHDDENRRVCGIVPLSSICRLLQLVPIFGPRMNPQLNASNSMDVWSSYYINSFMDKETYQAVW
jgi:hypothetical protein